MVLLARDLQAIPKSDEALRDHISVHRFHHGPCSGDALRHCFTVEPFAEADVLTLGGVALKPVLVLFRSPAQCGTLF